MIINVTLKLPDGREIVLPLDEARKLYYNLHSMFGGQQAAFGKWKELPPKWTL